jgi:hypothetical protein
MTIELALVPLILLGVVVVAPFFWALPAALDRSHAGLLKGMASALVEGVHGAFGGRNRFFLPIWLVSLAGSSVGMWSAWGAWGVAASVGGLTGLVSLLLTYAFVADARGWEDAPDALQEARLAQDPGRRWRWMREALYVPVLRGWTPEMCAHNEEVLETLGRWVDASGTDREVILRLRDAFHVAAETSRPDVPRELVAFAQDLVQHQGPLTLPELPAMGVSRVS